MYRFLLVGPFMVILPLAIVGSGVAKGQVPEKTSLEEHRQARRELAQRQRRIIMNNDGCDVLYFPQDEKATVEAFLAKRTSPLADTHVDAIAFCPTSSGFGFFTHNTKVGTVLTRSGREYGIQPNTRNIAQELIDQGTDCLQAVVEFGRKHDMEVFWSMRMNDTHDVSHHPENPYLLFPPLKEAHPDWLVGDHVKRTPHGRWSSVDYSHPEVRNLAFGFIDEVCHGYDVDGVELDFFRHLCYFKNTALGGTASDEERNMMTGLMRRVRRMTEDVGMKRGRPILVAIRVPDSTGFCRDMGLDVEKWMREGLIDILITTCYFRLNPWQYSVDLGHKHRVQVYPCLSDSRVLGETRFRRGSGESYRGRAMNAWTAGADGLHLFNHFNPNDPMWKEIGDPVSLLVMDKLYFASVRDGDPRSFLARGREYRNVPVVGPSNQRLVTASEPVTLEIEIGDDLAAAQRRGYKPSVTLHLEMPSIKRVELLHVALNDTKLAGGLLSEGWIDFSVPASSLKQGTNEVNIAANPSALGHADWSVAFDARNQPGRAWSRDRGSAHAVAEMVNDTLLIADRGEASGDYLYYRYPWGADPDGEAVVEARVKVESGSSYIIVTNGIGGERVGLWPDRIELFHYRSIQYEMDTTDDFHLYRIELKAQGLKVFVDGVLRIHAPDAIGPRSGYARNEVALGAANSPQQGTAYWRDIKARASGLTLRDLAVSVKYDKQ
jgi:hypothetical protein